MKLHVLLFIRKITVLSFILFILYFLKLILIAHPISCLLIRVVFKAYIELVNLNFHMKNPLCFPGDIYKLKDNY